MNVEMLFFCATKLAIVMACLAVLISCATAKPDPTAIFCKGRGKEFVWCIPGNYNKAEEPFRYQSLANKSFPWDHKFRYDIKQVTEV